MSAIVTGPRVQTSSEPTTGASVPAARPWRILASAGISGPADPWQSHPVTKVAASGPPNSRTHATTTRGSIADPRSHGAVASLATPSGMIAYMTTPRAMPVPMPMARAGSVTHDFRAVAARTIAA